jgi:hypothetical protein
MYTSHPLLGNHWSNSQVDCPDLDSRSVRVGSVGGEKRAERADEHLIGEAEPRRPLSCSAACFLVCARWCCATCAIRAAKSTSIGVESAAGEYIAALRPHLDVSVLSPATLAPANLVVMRTVTLATT